jgi:hypothetical protein
MMTWRQGCSCLKASYTGIAPPRCCTRCTAALLASLQVKQGAASQRALGDCCRLCLACCAASCAAVCMPASVAHLSDRQPVLRTAPGGAPKQQSLFSHDMSCSSVNLPRAQHDNLFVSCINLPGALGHQQHNARQHHQSQTGCPAVIVQLHTQLLDPINMLLLKCSNDGVWGWQARDRGSAAGAAAAIGATGCPAFSGIPA